MTTGTTRVAASQEMSVGTLALRGWEFRWSSFRVEGWDLHWTVESMSWTTATRVSVLLDEGLFRGARMGPRVRQERLMMRGDAWLASGRARYDDELWARVTDFAVRMEREARG